MPDEARNGQEREPSPWRSIGRLVHHTIHILFYAGLHWLLRLALQYTGQAHEWWTPIVLTGTGVMFIISFFVIGGSELIGDCWEAIRIMRRRVRGG